MPKKDPYKVPYPLVQVIWKDAVHDCDGAKASDDLRPAILVTTGYLIREDENGDLLIANEVDTREAWARHRNVIPNEMIVEWREI